MKHIEIETLIRKFERQLAVTEEQEITSHLAGCGECRVEAAKLADFFTYAESHRTGEVPQAATARILNLYQRKPPINQTEAKNGFSNIASLIFDDWQMAVNERFSGSDTRQLLYRVGECEIDLRLELVGEMCRVSGQIFPECAGAEVEISSATHTAASTVNEFGEFTLDPIPQGNYDFRIRIDDEVLNIEKILLGM
jgi:hypothetical protein